MPAGDSKFAIDQEVIVRADGRSGIVRNYWKARTDASSFVTGHKYLVEFPDGKKEYFTTTRLKAKGA